MMDSLSTEDLEKQLNSFYREERDAALAELLARNPLDEPIPLDQANMHCHTFYSFNAFGYSPSGVAWAGRKAGIGLMGIVDFDVLDGVDEFLEACKQAEIRGSAALETRVFVPEFADREINSPGEPGIYYYMGIGFPQTAVPEPVSDVRDRLREIAEERNRSMTERVNEYLDTVRIDYDEDVLSLTPAGNATERHMLSAYIRKVEQSGLDADRFWSEKLGLALEEIQKQRANPAVFQNTVRSKLMKRGGAGYVQPDGAAFPTVEEVNRLIVACHGLPCATWLDGFSAGEEAMGELLNLLIEKGAAALNIVPDRNWNLSDPELKRRKVQKLYEVVELAQEMDLPLNIGTEMNAPGQKLVDDFAAPELAPVKEAFLDGACFIYGHTLMQRELRQGYQSHWARHWLPGRAARNEFYTQIGRMTPPGESGISLLRKAGSFVEPDRYLRILEE